MKLDKGKPSLSKERKKGSQNKDSVTSPVLNSLLTLVEAKFQICRSVSYIFLNSR